MPPRCIRKAVFPVAGLGTRFLPATKVMPKEMLTVVDRPLIQWAVEEAAAAGIEVFILVTSRGKWSLIDHFDHHEELYSTLSAKKRTKDLEAVARILPEGAQIASTRQSRPLGLGHAVWCARHLIGDEPFAVLLPDDLVLAETPCLKQMVAVYEKAGGNVVAVMDVPKDQTHRYGILKTGRDDGREGGLAEIKGLVEKPAPGTAPSTLSIIGRYILQPEIFAALESVEKGSGGEIQLTDAMAKLIGRQPFHGLRFAGTRFDCGDKAGFVAANLAFALRRPDLAPAVRKAAAALLAS
jgi:UTP--glucose-1-phosphate uridylyltransferase